MKAGLMGFGSMGQKHFRVLDEMGCRPTVVLETNADAGNVDGTQFVNRSQDFDASDLDFLVVATPTDSHLSSLANLSSLPKTVLIEKPLALGVEQALAIEKLLLHSGSTGFVNYVERHNPATRYVKELLDLGPSPISASFKRMGPNPARVKDIGAVYDLFTHDLDLASYLLGSDVSVLASNVLRTEPNNRAEDGVQCLGLCDGTSVTFEVNWFSPTKERIARYQFADKTIVSDTLNLEVEIFSGTDQALSWNSLDYLKGGANYESVKPRISRIEPLRSVHADIIEYLSSGTISGRLATVSDAIKNLSLMDEILLKAGHDARY